MQSYKKKVVWRGEVKKNSPPWPLKNVNGMGGVINPYTVFAQDEVGCFAGLRVVLASDLCISVIGGWVSWRKGSTSVGWMSFLASAPCCRAIGLLPQKCFSLRCFCVPVLFVCCVVRFQKLYFVLSRSVSAGLVLFCVHLSEIHDVLPTSSCLGALRVGHVCQVLGVIPRG